MSSEHRECRGHMRLEVIHPIGMPSSRLLRRIVAQVREFITAVPWDIAVRASRNHRRRIRAHSLVILQTEGS